MPRKPKGTELTQEQLIEMQALFEGSGYGSVKIAEIMHQRHNVTITEGSVRHYAKKEGWVKDKKKEYYNAKKVAKVEETLAKAKSQDKEYKLITKISKQAEAEGEKVALLTMRGELFRQQIEDKYARIILSALDNMKTAQELIKSGKVTDTEFEYLGNVIDKETGKVVKAKILKKTRVLLPKDQIDFIKIGQGFGFIQTPQQQQNTQINIGTQQPQNIPVEVATAEEMVEIRKQIIKQVK